MATTFDRVEFIHKLENTGLDRKQAEAISWGMVEATRNLVTNERMEAAMDRQLIRIGGLFVVSLTAAVAVLAAILSN